MWITNLIGFRWYHFISFYIFFEISSFILFNHSWQLERILQLFKFENRIHCWNGSLENIKYNQKTRLCQKNMLISNIILMLFLWANAFVIFKKNSNYGFEIQFSNSLIIHQVKTKEIITVTMVGKCDLNLHNFLRFYFFVYSLVLVSIEKRQKIYQTLETVFHYISKYLEFRQKYSAARRIFNFLLSVWKYDETLSLLFDILHSFLF